jgi:beta-glucosidase
MNRRFPDSFLFGTSTASYQIEGATAIDGRKDSIWDVFCRKPGAIENGETGEKACDSYHRFDEDIRLIRNAGLGAYRFSIAWPRVIPDGTGAVNQRGLDYYERVVDTCLECAIDPWPCLYHWDLPQALQDRGGWAARDMVGWFCEYAEKTMHRLADRVSHVVLLNEPSIFTILGHLNGTHAPGIKDRATFLAAAHTTNRATGQASRALRALSENLLLGNALALIDFRPLGHEPADRNAADNMSNLWNWSFVDPLVFGRYPEKTREYFGDAIAEGDLGECRSEIDFIGINHYNPVWVRADSDDPTGSPFTVRAQAARKGAPTTEMGWEIDPTGLSNVLEEIGDRIEGIPFYITENGAAFSDRSTIDGRVVDTDRIAYLHGYLNACLDAIDRCIDLRGYFVWSLLDNFEWGYGYGKRFGIVHVDFDSLARKTKASYDWVAQLASSRQVPPVV